MKGDRLWSVLLRAKAFSPAGFLKYAILFALLHGICRALGWKACMSALSLTVPPGWSLEGAALAGGLFLLSWFLLVFAVPVLVLASLSLALLLHRVPSIGVPPTLEA